MKKVLLVFVFSIFSVFSISAQTNRELNTNIEFINDVAVNQVSKEDNKEKIETIDENSPTDGSEIQMNQQNKIPNTATPILRMLENKSLGEFSTGDQLIDSYIENSCLQHNIDPLLIYAQINQESSFRKNATSNKGASGLMQLMPATAIRFGVKNIYNPKQNIEAGVKYMRWLLDKFDGDLSLALAGYNAGEGAVAKFQNKVPPYRETQAYVARILTHYNRISIPAALTIGQLNEALSKIR